MKLMRRGLVVDSSSCSITSCYHETFLMGILMGVVSRRMIPPPTPITHPTPTPPIPREGSMNALWAFMYGKKKWCLYGTFYTLNKGQ